MNRLPTATRVDAHRRVILEDHVTGIVHIQERHRGQMVGNTAWSRYFRLFSNSVDKRLDGSVICWLQSLGEWIRAAAGTVVRLECLRRDDPMAPADVGEVHL